MALIKCAECGKEMSDKAACCPHCGCPITSMETENIEVPAVATQSADKPVKKRKTWRIIPVVVAILIGAYCLPPVQTRIKIWQDKTPPTISTSIEADTINAGESYDIERFGIIVTDDLDGDISDSVVIKGDINNSEIGEYPLEIVAVDRAGNIASKMVTIIVKDKYSIEEIIACRAMNNLRDRLKNPESLQIHQILVQIRKNISSLKYSSSRSIDTDVTGRTWYSVAFEYSAQNGFGGMNRDWYYLTYHIGNDGSVYYRKIMVEDDYQLNTFLYYPDCPVIEVNIKNALQAQVDPPERYWEAD